MSKLYLFGDNCSGQNKNHTLVRMMMSLCETKKFDDIELRYPVRGHSFMPNDRDFGIIRRKLRKEERYYTIDEVIDLIKTSSKKSNKFSIVEMKFDDFVDHASWWPDFYKKTCLSNDSYGKNVPKNQKTTFTISKYREMTFSSKEPCDVKCNMNIAGLRGDTFKLRNTRNPIELPSKKAYTAELPINVKKMDDIKKR